MNLHFIQKLTVVFLSVATLFAADFPHAEISNGVVTAKFYLPDTEKGYYRGTRFDWSGQIYSLKTGGNEYFGQWFPKYDPKLHDAIMGPVEEFKTNDAGLGYHEAKAGDTFIRIGVGTVRKPDDGPYKAFKTYDIVDSGKWTVRNGKDWIEFTHELDGKNGYAYRYTKTVRLTKGEHPGMQIEHTLQNTGSKKIETNQYNHNFFVMNQQPTGPATRVIFPFELKAVKPFPNDFAVVKGKEIHYSKELEMKESTYAEFDGFGSSASDFDIRMENAKAGTGVRIRGDQPIAKMVYWAIRSTFCPEPYINIAVESGKSSSWKYTYDFYPVQSGK